MGRLAATAGCLAIIASLADASQPSAPAPVAAPMRDLAWGKINFLHTTDTHGWLAGHLQEAQYSADWGDYISFATRMREKADEQGVDLILVDTGDRVDGNGLYDASRPKGQFTYDIFKEQDIDVLCTGNHELYEADATYREFNQTVPNFKGHYLASNLDIIDKDNEQKPLAQRYRQFTTKNQGIRVTAFGFLFDFTGNANNSVVQKVEKTIKEDWFQEAIRLPTDLFLVIGHVALRGSEYKAIYTAIRKQNWDTPIQFFGGHAHVRDYVKFDSSSYALASGRYLETIGWMSIDGIKGKGDNGKTDVDEASGISTTAASLKFQRRYIDNNLYGYYHHTGLNESTFHTEKGRNVSSRIAEARKTLNLDSSYGCAPQDLWLNRAKYPSNDSLISWLEEKVLPDIISDNSPAETPTIAMINTGAMRFDIFKGAFTIDTTFIVSPFTTGFKHIENVPYSAAKQVLKIINSGGRFLEAAGLDTDQLAGPEHIHRKQYAIREPHVYDEHPDRAADQQVPLGSPFLTSEPDLVPGYTTKDDAGNDGDDTIHAPITFYDMPNCVQSEVSFPSEGDPETVDFVYLKFIEPWVLQALKLTGLDYSKENSTVYAPESSFTDLIADWIGENWKKQC